MTTWQFLLSAWHWDLFALALGMAVIVLRFTILHDHVARGNFLALAAGIAVLLVALVSPIRVLAESYLFSAHMLQHLLLLLVVPPLLLSSLPRLSSKKNIDRRMWPNRSAWIPLAWLSGVGAMWLWHAPALCDAATTSQVVFRLQIVSLVGLGLLFWLPICGPVLEWRLSPLTGIIYLFTACFACTLLGIYITFTPVTVCSIYAHPVDRFGILPLIQAQWGLTPAVDQRIGGLMMWVPACSIYLAGILTLLARWYGEAEEPAEMAGAEGQMKPKQV